MIISQKTNPESDPFPGIDFYMLPVAIIGL